MNGNSGVNRGTRMAMRRCRHGGDGESVRAIASVEYSITPIITEPRYLRRIELPTEPSVQLGVIVAVEAKNGKVRKVVVRMISIDMMDLHRPSSNATDTACSLSRK